MLGEDGWLRNSYYGWRVLAACSVLGLMTGGIFYRGFTVFFLPIQRDLDLSRAATSLIFALSVAEGGLSGPLLGYLIDKLGSRPLIIVGGLYAGVGFIALSFVDSYLPFLIVYLGMVSAGVAVGLDPTLMAAVNRWFVRRKAVALSVLTSSYPLGGVLFVPLLGLGVSVLGWRDVVLYTGIFLCIVVVPPALYVLKSPESAGIPIDAELDRVPAAGKESGDPSPPVEADFTVREALRTRSYWLLISATCLRIGGNSAMLVHLVPILVWKGTEELTAASIAALYFFLTVPMRMSAGFLAQRYNMRKLLFGAMLWGAFVLVGLVLLEGNWVPLAFVFCMVLIEICTPINWAVFGSFFGRRSFATLYGFTSMFVGTLMLVSPVYAGWIFDRTDEYDIALFTFAIFNALSGVLFLSATRPRTPRRVAVRPD